MKEIHHLVAFGVLLLALIVGCGKDDISGMHPQFCEHQFEFQGIETDPVTLKERACIQCTRWCKVRHCSAWRGGYRRPRVSR